MKLQATISLGFDPCGTCMRELTYCYYLAEDEHVAIIWDCLGPISVSGSKGKVASFIAEFRESSPEVAELFSWLVS